MTAKTLKASEIILIKKSHLARLNSRLDSKVYVWSRRKKSAIMRSSENINGHSIIW